MIYVLIPTCILLAAKLSVMNIDLKASRKAYADLKDKYNSLVDEYF